MYDDAFGVLIAGLGVVVSAYNRNLTAALWAGTAGVLWLRLLLKL